MKLNRILFINALAFLFTFSACVKKDGVTSAENANLAGSEILFGEYGSMTGSESTFGIQLIREF